MRPFRWPLAMAGCAAAASAALVAPATAASAAPYQAPRACFFASQLSSWKEAGDRTVYLRVGVSDIYELQLVAPCPDLKYSEAVGIEAGAGSDHICSGLDVTLRIPRGVVTTGPGRCMGTSLRKLSREEAKALPKGSRP